VAQFLGAFNDNALRTFLIALAVKKLQDRDQVSYVISLAPALFLLPYLFFSMHAGSLADHFSKRTVLMWSKAAEALILAIAVMGFLTQSDFVLVCSFLLAVLFLLGIQATYYSPAKFGVLPEILPERLLSWGNGVFEMTGVLAIIAGCASGPSFVALPEKHYYLAPLVFTLAALLGLLATWFVPRLPPAAPNMPMRINPLSDLLTYGGRLVRHRVLTLTLLAVVYMWSLGLLFQLNIAMYAKEALRLDEANLGLPMAMVAVGIGIGNVAAGYLSGKTIEIGLVPLASVGMALFSAALYFTAGSMPLTFVCIGILGCFAGLFIVPTHALLQEESAVEDKGGIWAATNFLQTVGMLLASGFFALLCALGLTPPAIFLVCGIGTLVASFFIVLILPEALGRMILWAKGKALFRVQVGGQEHVPAHGPILFVVNGPPALEGFLLLAGTRRFVRFALPPESASTFLLRTFARSLKAIWLPSPSLADLDQKALEEMENALRSGDSVAVFAGAPSAGPAGGLAALVKKGLAPVIPVQVERLENDSPRQSLLILFEPALGHLDLTEVLAALAGGEEKVPRAAEPEHEPEHELGPAAE
jgi:acyl-[acyl-carrier-protein]-phospholipid O-acyltransferase/long-chain-fatty-acid--[acyl-carrier-protein] ligase